MTKEADWLVINSFVWNLVPSLMFIFTIKLTVSSIDDFMWVLNCCASQADQNKAKKVQTVFVPMVMCDYMHRQGEQNSKY